MKKLKSQIPQRISNDDVIKRAKMVMILRAKNIWSDEEMARCFKVSNENFWSIVKYIKQNKWLLNK